MNGSGIAAVACQARRPGSAPDLPVLLGLLAFSLLARAVALPHPVADPDESLYFVQAQRWLRGEWPYSTGVWDLHPVGAPALLAAAFAVFGEAVWVARVLASLAVGATAFLLHRMLVASGAGWQAGIAAGLLYSAHTLRLGGLATNTEVLFAPFVAGAVLVLYRAILSVAGGRAARLRDAVAAGLLFGVAIWIKRVLASRPEIIVLGRGGAFDPRDPADPALIRTIAAALAEDYAPVEVIEREVVVEVHRLRGRPPSPPPPS
jgi:4-amino-4-deoxy-L-arabinose transferase-like glycosyltransferase